MNKNCENCKYWNTKEPLPGHIIEKNSFLKRDKNYAGQCLLLSSEGYRLESHDVDLIPEAVAINLFGLVGGQLAELYTTRDFGCIHWMPKEEKIL